MILYETIPLFARLDSCLSSANMKSEIIAGIAASFETNLDKTETDAGMTKHFLV